MRCGHANCLQDRGESIQAAGQLGEAMLHEAVPDDQTQWDRSPTGDRRSADQIDGKVAPRWRPSLDVAGGSHIQSTVLPWAAASLFDGGSADQPPRRFGEI